MKKLSEALTELGIAFSFPIEIKDANGNVTYYEDSSGGWYRREYDANGNVTYHENYKGSWQKWERDADGYETYYETSDGIKGGTPRSAKTCEIDGIK
jgi:YD repeat-containing protein|tara:strand:- start:70 stop:360 length:291 start_codon:yes stop_codon:yes gene_type:complete